MTEKRIGATTFTVVSDLELKMSRVFDAPRELVFAVYTDPKHIPHWWGPGKSATIVDQMDVRPGGRWRYIQREADGTEWAFNGEYHDVVPPERLVSTFIFEGLPDKVVVDSATFEEHDGKTTVTVISRFASIEDRDGMLQSGMETGAAETWDRLAELLATLQ